MGTYPIPLRVSQVDGERELRVDEVVGAISGASALGRTFRESTAILLCENPDVGEYILLTGALIRAPQGFTLANVQSHI